MGKLLNLLGARLNKLTGYKSGFREMSEVIDDEIKAKTGREIFCYSDKSRIYGTVKLIQLAENSLMIRINHRNHHELEVVNDSCVYNALYDAAHRGVSIDIVLTDEAYRKLSRDILEIADLFITDTDEFHSSVLIDGKLGKSVYSKNGKTHFWFC